MNFSLSQAAALTETPDAGGWLGTVQEWVDQLPESLQWLGMIAAGAIPFIESYSGGILGLVTGIPILLATGLAIIGNVLMVYILVFAATGTRRKLTANKPVKERTEHQNKRRQRVESIFNRFGVPGVSLLGPLALPSQLTAPLMASLGASRSAILLWMTISIVVWGAVGAVLAYGALSLLG